MLNAERNGPRAQSITEGPRDNDSAGPELQQMRNGIPN